MKFSGFRFVIAIGLLLASTDASFSADRHLKDIVNDPWFWEVTAASGLGWFLGTLKGFSGSKEWLARYGIVAPKLLILIIDLVVYVGIGGFVGVAIYEPTTLHAAMAAGVSWPLGLGALTTK